MHLTTVFLCLKVWLCIVLAHAHAGLNWCLIKKSNNCFHITIKVTSPNDLFDYLRPWEFPHRRNKKHHTNACWLVVYPNHMTWNHTLTSHYVYSMLEASYSQTQWPVVRYVVRGDAPICSYCLPVSTTKGESENSVWWGRTPLKFPWEGVCEEITLSLNKGQTIKVYSPGNNEWYSEWSGGYCQGRI